MKHMCELVVSGKRKRRGRRACSFVEEGRIYFDCYGYYDPKTKTPLPECLLCERFWRDC